MYYDLTLERALTLGARFCHRAPNARALSITDYSVCIVYAALHRILITSVRLTSYDPGIV